MMKVLGVVSFLYHVFIPNFYFPTSIFLFPLHFLDLFSISCSSFFLSFSIYMLISLSLFVSNLDEDKDAAYTRNITVDILHFVLSKSFLVVYYTFM